MGHNRLSRIPATTSWRRVVDLLGTDAVSSEVISAAAHASRNDLLEATDDAVYVEAVRMLLSIPLAARADDFGQELRGIGLRVSENPELLDLVTAVTERLDEIAGTASARNDLGELAARSLSNTLVTMVGERLPGLFGSTPDDVRIVLRSLSWSKGISEFTRHFFAALVSECLSYWLDRTLAMETGEHQRFRNSTDRGRFDVELQTYATECTRIIKEFSGGWYGKTLHREGHFGTKSAAVFGAVALKKIVEEMRVRDAQDA